MPKISILKFEVCSETYLVGFHFRTLTNFIPNDIDLLGIGLTSYVANLIYVYPYSHIGYLCLYT